MTMADFIATLLQAKQLGISLWDYGLNAMHPHCNYTRSDLCVNQHGKCRGIFTRTAQLFKPVFGSFSVQQLKKMVDIICIHLQAKQLRV